MTTDVSALTLPHETCMSKVKAFCCIGGESNFRK